MTIFIEIYSAGSSLLRLSFYSKFEPQQISQKIKTLINIGKAARLVVVVF